MLIQCFILNQLMHITFMPFSKIAKNIVLQGLCMITSLTKKIKNNIYIYIYIYIKIYTQIYMYTCIKLVL
jgi:hypothetical protein